MIDFKTCQFWYSTLKNIYYYCKNKSTYHKKHHLFLIHHYYLHNHHTYHKFPNYQYICHYYTEIAKTRMMVFLNVRQNQLTTTKSHLKHSSLQLLLISINFLESLRLWEIRWHPQIYLPSKTLLSREDQNFCLLLFVFVMIVVLLPFT